MDEPFSGLDIDERVEIRQVLRGIRAAGVSILLVDHAVHEVLDIADHVTVLDFGEVLASGSPEAIREDPDVRSAYFGSADVATGGRA